MLRHRVRCLVLAALAFTTNASAQIEVAWWNAYDLPESFDGDSATHSIAVSSTGGVLAAVRTNFFAASRFVRYGPSGAIVGSVLAPAPYIFSKSLLAPSGDVYFAGVARPPAQGFMLVKLSSSGALLWSRAVLAATTFQRVEALFDANGEIVVVGSVDTRAVIAGLNTTAGQLAWREVNAGALGLGANYVALARGANGEIAVAGNSTLAGSSDVWVTTIDSSGVVLWSAAIDAGANTAETVTDIEYSSDGALWVSGFTASSGQATSFFLRFPEGSSVPAQLLWNSHPSLVWSQAKHLAAGGPGQMWALADFLELGAPLQVGAFQLDFDGNLRVEIGASFDAGGSEKQLECAALGPGQTVVVGGRSEDVPGGLSFFDPVSMVAKFDFSDAPREYCQAQTNSAGCVPVLSCAGRASLTSPQAFRIRVGDVIPGVAGLFVYGATGPSSTPFLGGLKCVASPISRSPMLLSTSSGSGPCPGEFAIDWNAFARGQLGGVPAPELTVPGTAIYLQCWSRDGGAAFGANLASALQYVVLP